MIFLSILQQCLRDTLVTNILIWMYSQRWKKYRIYERERLRIQCSEIYLFIYSSISNYRIINQTFAIQIAIKISQFWYKTLNNKSISITTNHMNVTWIIMKNYDDSKFAKRFFVNCERKFENSSIHSWIYAMKVCFIDKTTSWVSQQSEIQNILDLKKSNEENKQRFIALIRQKYSNQKSLTHKQWMTQFKKFKQDENDESFEQYYRRTYEILRNFDDQNKEKNDNDAILSLSKIIVLNHIIEKFVNELHDSQFRCKMRYKYLITSNRYLITFEWNLYETYEVAEQISNYITSKKKTLENEFEKKLSIMMQTQNTTIALKFAMKNQLKLYTSKSKTIFVDRIERYRRISQRQKFENTMQKQIARKKLTQLYIDENFSNSNISTLSTIFERFQIISHFDSSICEIIMTLFSQSQSNYDFVFYEQIIRFEKLVEREKSIENCIFDFRKWFASVTISVVNEFSFVLKQILCNLSKINANIVNINDIKSKKMIFLFLNLAIELSHLHKKRKFLNLQLFTKHFSKTRLYRILRKILKQKLWIKHVSKTLLMWKFWIKIFLL